MKNLNAIIKSDRRFTAIITFLVLCIIGYLIYDNTTLKVYIHPDYKEAHTACKLSVKIRATEFEQAILERKSRIPELAESLVGWGAKCKAIGALGDEDEVNAWVSDKVEQSLYNDEENQRLLAQHIAAVIADWKEAENELARKIERPVVGNIQQGAPVTIDDTEIPAGMNRELWEQIMYEVAANLGGEIAGALATQMAISGGIITASAGTSWATCGISLVAGLVVTWIVSIVVDPTPELEAQLNKQLENNAADIRKKFEEVMLNVLDKRIEEWD